MQFRRGSPLPGGGRKAGLGEEAVGIPEMAKRDVAERIVDEVVGLRAANPTHSERQGRDEWGGRLRLDLFCPVEVMLVRILPECVVQFPEANIIPTRQSLAIA